MRRTSSYSLRFSASPSTSYAAETSLKRSSASLLPVVGVGVDTASRASCRRATSSLSVAPSAHAEHGVVVLLEPLALRRHRSRSLVTFTIAGRSTRPFNFHPVRSTSPTTRLAVAVVLHHRFVLVRVERRARRVDALEPVALEHADAARRTRARRPCARFSSASLVEVAQRELEVVEHGQQLLDQAFRSRARRARSARAARACGSSRSRPAAGASCRAARRARAAASRGRLRTARSRRSLRRSSFGRRLAASTGSTDSGAGVAGSGTASFIGRASTITRSAGRRRRSRRRRPRRPRALEAPHRRTTGAPTPAAPARSRTAAS